MDKLTPAEEATRDFTKIALLGAADALLSDTSVEEMKKEDALWRKLRQVARGMSDKQLISFHKRMADMVKNTAEYIA